MANGAAPRLAMAALAVLLLQASLPGLEPPARAPPPPAPARRELQARGCTDTLADNHQPGALEDDGDCEYACAAGVWTGADVWNQTVRGVALIDAGSELAATCTLLQMVLGDMPTMDCCSPCCEGCCGEDIVVGAGTRHVVQGRVRSGHRGVIYATDGIADDTTRTYPGPNLAPVQRPISAGAGAFLAVRRLEADPDLFPDEGGIPTAQTSYILAEDGCLLVEDCYFRGNSGSGSGVITMRSGGEVVVKTSQFEANRADLDPDHPWTSGGAISLPDGGKLTVSQSIFKDNVGFGGGAIYVGGAESAPSTVVVVGSLFRENSLTSGGHGGSLSTEAGRLSTVELTNSGFIGNYAQPPSGADDGGAGGVWQSQGTVHIDGCTFEPHAQRTTTKGQSLSVSEVLDWSVKNTVFEDYTACSGNNNGEPSTDTGCSVFTERSGPAGCAEHPCEPGQRCDYREMSIWCNDCIWPSVSVDGVSCLMCPPGRGPIETLAEPLNNLTGPLTLYDLTGCEECDDGKYSAHGTCNFCDAGSVPATNHSAAQVLLLREELERMRPATLNMR